MQCGGWVRCKAIRPDSLGQDAGNDLSPQVARGERSLGSLWAESARIQSSPSPPATPSKRPFNGQLRIGVRVPPMLKFS